VVSGAVLGTICHVCCHWLDIRRHGGIILPDGSVTGFGDKNSPGWVHCDFEPIAGIDTLPSVFATDMAALALNGVSITIRTGLEMLYGLTPLLCSCCRHQDSSFTSSFHTRPRKFLCANCLRRNLFSVTAAQLIGLEWLIVGSVCSPVSIICIFSNCSPPRIENQYPQADRVSTRDWLTKFACLRAYKAFGSSLVRRFPPNS
jgi:hypothetical protein